MRNLLHLLAYLAGRAEAETQTSPAERDAIARWATGRRCCVEVGVWHGVSTRRIRRVMAADGVLTGVDPFPRGRLGFSIPMAVARREIAKSGNGTFRLVRLTGEAAARSWRDPIDFLFIDGDHTWDGLRCDWEGFSPHVAHGGVVCLHDSRSSCARNIEGAGSVRYTSEVILRDQRFRVVETVETLTVLERVREAAA